VEPETIRLIEFIRQAAGYVDGDGKSGPEAALQYLIRF
jgi:hypothetical protein